MAPYFQIIFRTCDVVNAVNRTPRPFNLDKKTIIKSCFKSLYDAVKNHQHTITVLGDKLSAEMMAYFKQYPVALSNGDYGNDESIRQTIALATTFPDEHWVYFCEDDYLHRPETFRYICNFIQNKESIIANGPKKFFSKKNYYPAEANLCFFPADYPDRYLPHDREPVLIFQSPDCHWRQVANITFTVLLQAKVVKKYRKVFEASAKGANDGYLSDMLFRKKNYGKENICLSPLPGLTSHMHTNTLTPVINWEQLIKQYLPAL